VEQFFPVEIAAQKVDLLHALIAGVLNVVQIDQFGNTGKAAVGSASQQGINTVIKAAHIDGCRFIAD